MKKRFLRTVSYFLTIILISLITTSAVFYVKLFRSHDKLEEIVRLENQAMIEIKNGQFLYACKTIIAAKNTLKNADYASDDMLGLIHSSSIEICNKANKN
jgi:cell division protein YceG involved in septum cleavage